MSAPFLFLLFIISHVTFIRFESESLSGGAAAAMVKSKSDHRQKKKQGIWK